MAKAKPFAGKESPAEEKAERRVKKSNPKAYAAGEASEGEPNPDMPIKRAKGGPIRAHHQMAMTGKNPGIVGHMKGGGKAGKGC